MVKALDSNVKGAGPSPTNCFVTKVFHKIERDFLQEFPSQHIGCLPNYTSWEKISLQVTLWLAEVDTNNDMSVCVCYTGDIVVS